MVPTEHGVGREPSEPLSDGESFTIGICTVISGDRTAASHENVSRSTMIMSCVQTRGSGARNRTQDARGGTRSRFGSS